jgi:hypothetical protein
MKRWDIRLNIKRKKIYKRKKEGRKSRMENCLICFFQIFKISIYVSMFKWIDARYPKSLLNKLPMLLLLLLLTLNLLCLCFLLESFLFCLSSSSLCNSSSSSINRRSSVSARATSSVGPYVCMDGWMDGLIDGWIDGWMDEWMERWMDE